MRCGCWESEGGVESSPDAALPCIHWLGGACVQIQTSPRDSLVLLLPRGREKARANDSGGRLGSFLVVGSTS